jgi:hypothetical protein
MQRDLLTVSYHESEHAPVVREVEAVKVDPSRLWLAEAGQPFAVWEEFTPVWQNYTRMWLVVCADNDEILFPGDEQGFRLCVQQHAAALYLYQRHSSELAHTHDDAPWAWSKEEGSGLWYGGIDALTIAPASYFARRYEQDPQEILKPRDRPSALAERLR